MSVLSYPRVHFNGRFFTNVCTANNDDAGFLLIDPVHSKLLPPLAQ
jgi:hypothetical protein